MIGRMKKVPLKEVWKHEARDFTSWLEKNIEVLGEELDIDLTMIEREKDVGIFSADLLAEDQNGQKVIIENQLNKTDHDHLGKIITYISNLDAKIAIWISSNPRPEHVQAIDWLNETASDIKFYLVKIEAYKIDNSVPAPKFFIVSGPSKEAKKVGEEKQKTAKRHNLRFEFWQNLLEKSKKKTDLHSNISPNIYSWIGTGAGRAGLGFNYAITYKLGQVELYIDRGQDSKEENKNIFDQLYARKEEIEKEFAGKLDWERLDNRRACRIKKSFDYAGLEDKEKWDKLQDDMIDAMIRLEESFKKPIRELKI